MVAGVAASSLTAARQCASASEPGSSGQAVLGARTAGHSQGFKLSSENNSLCQSIAIRALAILHEWVKTTGAEMNEARLRMTRIPKGADLILNKVSLDVEIEHVNAGPKRTRDPGGTLYQGGGKRKAGVLRASQVFWRPVREMHNVMNLSERPARRAR